MERKQAMVKKNRPGQSHPDRYTFGAHVNHDMSRVKNKKLLNIAQFNKLEDRWVEYQD